MVIIVGHSFQMRARLLILSVFLYPLAAAQDIRVPPSITKENIQCQDSATDRLCLYRDGGDVTIECGASGYPAPGYNWFKNDALIDTTAPNIQPKADGSLVISQATSREQGYYQCRAENVYGTALGKAYQLQMTSIGSYEPNLPVAEYSASPGEALEITCKPLKSVPAAVYSWDIAIDPVDKKPVQLSTSQRVNFDPFGNLHFAYIENGDNQEGKLYKCNVYNAQLDLTVGGSYSIVNILNPGTPPNAAPVIKYYETAQPYIALVGAVMTIQCLFSGNPAPSITWSKRNGQLPDGRTDMTSFNSKLDISGITEADEGPYRCTGSNSAGRADQDIYVKVEAVPVFSTATSAAKPLNTNATEGDDVTFNCKPYAIPMATTQWLMNGIAINAGNPPERMSISANGQSLTISNVCKDCSGERATDLMVIQCNASNAHGYAFGEGYLNVLLPTVFTVSPPPQAQLNSNTTLELHCHATSDASTTVNYQWQFEDQKIILDPPSTNIDKNNTLIISTKGLVGSNWEVYVGKYTCIATNVYSTVSADSLVELPPDVLPSSKPVTGASIGNLWWIILIVVAVLFLVILLLLLGLYMQRNKGDVYAVDKHERKTGNDPEQEIKNDGFSDYQRPNEQPAKEHRASLTASIKMDSDDEGSLEEYGGIDPENFREDGSFIGQYMDKNEKKDGSIV